MIKCKNTCPQDKFEGCCYSCPHNKDCADVCEMMADYEKCEDAVNEETALAEFQEKNIATIQSIADLCLQKKMLEEAEKNMKDQLKQAMEKYGIKKFESDILNITYVAPTTSTSIDSAKLKKLHPDIAEECSKISQKSSYIKVEVKGGTK